MAKYRRGAYANKELDPIEDDDGELVPVVASPPKVSVPVISPSSTDEEIQAADCNVVQFSLACLLKAVPHAYTIKQLCDLTTTTMNVLKERRQLLSRQYGAENTSNNRTVSFTVD